MAFAPPAEDEIVTPAWTPPADDEIVSKWTPPDEDKIVDPLASVKLSPYEQADMQSISEGKGRVDAFEPGTSLLEATAAKGGPLLALGGKAVDAAGNISRAAVTDNVDRIINPIQSFKHPIPNLRALVSGDELPVDIQNRELSRTDPNVALLGKLGQSGASMLPMAALGAAPAWANRLLAAGFSADMIKKAPQLFQDYAEEKEKPEAEQDPDKLSSLKSSIIQTFIFAPLAGGGVFHEGKNAALARELSNQLDQADFTPKEPAPVVPLNRFPIPDEQLSALNKLNVPRGTFQAPAEDKILVPSPTADANNPPPLRAGEGSANLQPGLEATRDTSAGSVSPTKPPPDITKTTPPDDIEQGGLSPTGLAPNEGMGGAKLGEVASPGNPDTYGIAQRVRTEREAAGQTAPTESGQGISAQDSVTMGKELLQAGADPEKVMQNFEQGGNRLNDEDIAIARAHGETLASQARTTEEQFGTESDEYQAAKQKLSDWDKRTKSMQTQWHKQGMAQQGETDIDTGTFTGLEREFRNQTGRDFDPSQAKKAKKVAEDVSKADKVVEPAKAQLQPAIDKIPDTVEPHIRLIADKLKGYFDKRATDALARIKARRASGRLFTGIDPTELADYADYGASKIINKGIKGSEMAADWAKEMVDELGEYIKPHLKQIWDAAQNNFETILKREAGAGSEKVRKAAKRSSATPLDLEGQRKLFADYESGKPLDQNQLKALWNRAKSEYIDKGNTDQADIVHKLATDLGISPKDVLKGMNQNRQVKRVADDVWQKQRQARLLKESAKRWLEEANKTWLAKLPKNYQKLAFSSKVFGHGGVALGTHAPLILATHPRIFAKAFGEMYKMVLSPEYYRMRAYEQARKPNYNVAQRAGLVNDMTKLEDFNDPQLALRFPKLAEFFRKSLAKIPVAKLLPGSGERGYSVLKTLRQDLFDNEWNKLAESEKSPQLAKAIADSVNHMTGVIKSGEKTLGVSIGGEGSNMALFAPKLYQSRLSVVAGDPVRALNSLTKMSNMTPEEKWFAVNQFKEKAKIFAVATSLLAANQVLNNMLGDKHKINGIPKSMGGGGWNPMESDFMKFKVAEMNVAWGSPFLTMLRLPLRIYQIGAGDGGKAKYLIYPDESMYKTVGEYARTLESPGLSPIVSLITKSDYQHRPLPQIPGYGAPSPVPKRLAAQGVKPYTWPEFGFEVVAPIPVEEGIKEYYHYLHHEDAGKLTKALLTTLMMGATGARVSEDWKK